MKRKDLWMVNTDVEVIKTIGDTQSYLVRMGANKIATHFDEKTREPIALYFTMSVNGEDIPFQLPARVEAIYKILHQGRNSSEQERDRSQAKRVAWRHIYRWIQAQLAMIETGMLAAEEVMTPYIQVDIDTSLYQRLAAGGLKRLLPASTETK